MFGVSELNILKINKVSINTIGIVRKIIKAFRRTIIPKQFIFCFRRTGAQSTTKADWFRSTLMTKESE